MAAYDPTIYLGSARFYAQGRPAYSAELASTLQRELGLDGTGRLLDVGCGPGIVALELASLFDEVVGLDPDRAMLDEAARRAAARDATNARWVEGRAEDIDARALGRFRVATFGQSFHWTERERVAEIIFDLLESGGALVCVVHTFPGRPVPVGPDLPPIPHDDVQALVERYLGPGHRAGQGYSQPPPDRYEDALARTRFGTARIVFAPGRPDIVRDIDSLVAGVFSMSWGAPHLFGERCVEFEADLRALLAQHAPEGQFWDWPGDTELVIATKPS